MAVDLRVSVGLSRASRFRTHLVIGGAQLARRIALFADVPGEHVAGDRIEFALCHTLLDVRERVALDFIARFSDLLEIAYLRVRVARKALRGLGIGFVPEFVTELVQHAAEELAVARFARSHKPERASEVFVVRRIGPGAEINARLRFAERDRIQKSEIGWFRLLLGFHDSPRSAHVRTNASHEVMPRAIEACRGSEKLEAAAAAFSLILPLGGLRAGPIARRHTGARPCPRRSPHR